MNTLKEISNKILRAKRVAIFTHISPDMDALSSSYALMAALNKSDIKADLFINEKLTFNQKLLYSEGAICNNECKINYYDLFVATDVSAINRLGDYGYIFDDKNETVILDHHVCDNEIGKFNFIDNKYSSASEIIFLLLKEMGVEIDDAMATLLYAGVSADTSSFQNSNTKANSFKTAYELCLLGANISKVNQILYENTTEKEIVFTKYLWNNYKKIDDCAFIVVDNKTLEQLGGAKSDCAFYSRALVSIHNINYSFSLVEEEKGVFSLSLRSKDGYNVKEKAERFGGGGHICAAGAKFNARNMKEAEAMVLGIFSK